ncbi:Asparagine synthase (glutamine-hydrolyzing) [Syntrophobotulus glycolicus DSM 8271]|uniref:asparagine synthase (glutamine-hydrolyzing) n=2 Tax=Syntrophobotulus TaxID=51196 RepID=F0SY80_SYNGF|nr:Asparagine synthase (glutamine-hydrolyzing) [Syntrophobotulus glycolicus DSM 8271]
MKIMSVIWGLYQKKGNGIEKEKYAKMIAPLTSIQFDRLDAFNCKDVYFGCGHQYITPESVYEILPRSEEKTGLCITADAIIDNRRELFETLAVDKELQEIITDSELILLAYRKWGQDCPKYLVGDFAFVIKDDHKNEIFCARDHVGKRTLYYDDSENVFAFSTLMKPLLARQDHMALNERWIADFLAIETTIHETECGETVYQGINQLPPAFWMRVGNGGTVKKQYWDPLREVKPLILKTDEEYEEAFRKVFDEAVACRLRSTGEVGIKMSGGIDSGSIGCIAAAQLAKKNKKLYSFSSIPMEGFKEQPKKNHIVDESENIQAIIDFAGNIEGELLRSEGKHALTDADKVVDMLEQPYKIFRNMYWQLHVTERAAQKGCKVLLSGSYGNFTISYGDFNTNTKTLFKKGKLITLYKEISVLSKSAGVSARTIAKGVFTYIVPYQLKDFLRLLRLREWDRFSLTVVNPQLIKKWNVESRFKLLGLNPRTYRTDDYEAFKKQRVNWIFFSHVGAVEVKQAVYSGVILRDPSRDKRLIEFCLSLPAEQFVRNGEDRFLIRRAMKGRMPDKILFGHAIGVQCADWLQRIKPYWEKIFTELDHIVKDQTINNYIDIEKVNRELILARENEAHINGDSVNKLLTTIVFSRFISWYTKYSPNN